MARGTTANIGTERTSPNGYRYRKTEDGWELVHRLLAEEKIGRKLTENEYATFKDGDKTNLEPTNIIIQIRGRSSLRRRLAQIDARLAELNAARVEVLHRLEVQEELGS